MRIDTKNWKTHEKNGVPFVTLPKNQLDAIIEELEDMEDNAALTRARKNKEESFSAELVWALNDAPHSGERVALFRKYRNMTRNALAEKVGVTGASITMIETGKRKGSISIFTKLTKALRIPLDMLIG